MRFSRRLAGDEPHALRLSVELLPVAAVGLGTVRAVADRNGHVVRLEETAVHAAVADMTALQHDDVVQRGAAVADPETADDHVGLVEAAVADTRGVLRDVVERLPVVLLGHLRCRRLLLIGVVRRTADAATGVVVPRDTDRGRVLVGLGRQVVVQDALPALVELLLHDLAGEGEEVTTGGPAHVLRFARPREGLMEVGRQVAPVASVGVGPVGRLLGEDVHQGPVVTLEGTLDRRRTTVHEVALDVRARPVEVGDVVQRGLRVEPGTCSGRNDAVDRAAVGLAVLLAALDVQQNVVVLCRVADQQLEELLERHLVGRLAERDVHVERRTVVRRGVLRRSTGRDAVHAAERLDELLGDLAALRRRQVLLLVLGVLLHLDDVPGEVDGPELQDVVDQHVTGEVQGTTQLVGADGVGVEKLDDFAQAVGVCGHSRSLSGKVHSLDYPMR